MNDLLVRAVFLLGGGPTISLVGWVTDSLLNLGACWQWSRHPGAGRAAILWWKVGEMGPLNMMENPGWWNMDVSENSGFSPKIVHFNRVFHYKPSILGALPYFWKHPYDSILLGINLSEPWKVGQLLTHFVFFLNDDEFPISCFIR